VVLETQLTPQVIQIDHTEDLVKTKKFKLGYWDFDEFNPIQSKLLEVYEGNTNIAIAAATSSGKTICAEMYMSYEIQKRKGKVIYVGPMKALAKEKECDWTSDEHHFSNRNVSIVTGDFRLTKKRIDELEKADIIVMTPEMLASRCRNNKSDKSDFLKDVGTVIFDEAHLLTVPSRGDHIEVALMKMVEINPQVRIILLSATMPNVDEICEWTSKLTGRDTYYLKSNYRPCPLHIHFESYYDGDRRYDQRESQKINSACAIVESYPDDKFLVFVHTKMTGRGMVTALKSCGVESEFHNADLNLKQRLDLEKRFRGKGLRVIVATSTLAWGMNLPARRVIVTGVHRGLEPVENYDIWQEVGRAGRPRFDPVGDAYILVPESEKSFWMAKLRKKSPIRSTLLNYVGNEDNPHYKTLAFHVVSEIHYGNIKTKEGFKAWFRESLAHHQDVGFDDSVIDRTINLLTQYRAIRVDEDGEYRCTPLGMIASLYYYSPFDVSDLRRNFHFVFEKDMTENDFALAMAMGNVDTYRWGVVSRYEREQMASFEARVKRMFGENSFTVSAIKIGYAYYNMLKGKKDLPAFAALQGALRVDLDRTMQVIQSIDSMSSKWGRKDWFKTLRLRLLYGVEPELVQLCQLPNVGQVRAKRLVAKKITTVGDFTSFDAATLSKVMKCSKKLAGEALESAKLIELRESLE
jgi:replicative superfamily II helicase